MSLVLSTPAVAQNVALGKPVSVTEGINLPATGAGRATDGTLNAENTFWQTNSLWWFGLNENVTVSLGGPFTITGFTIQADNNDQYLLEYRNGSADTWHVATVVPFDFNGGGVATRTGLTPAGGSITATDLRFSATAGDNDYSVTQIEAFGSNITTTPEPSELALLGTGLAGLIPIARRRKR